MAMVLVQMGTRFHQMEGRESWQKMRIDNFKWVANFLLSWSNYSPLLPGGWCPGSVRFEHSIIDETQRAHLRLLPLQKMKRYVVIMGFELLSDGLRTHLRLRNWLHLLWRALERTPISDQPWKRIDIGFLFSNHTQPWAHLARLLILRGMMIQRKCSGRFWFWLHTYSPLPFIQFHHE